MTNIRNIIACGALVAFAACAVSSFAQDDLDNLLKDLESEAAATAEAKKVEKKVEVEAEVEKKVEVEAEKKTEETVEEKAEEKSEVEEKTEAAVEEKSEERTEEVAEEKSEEAAEPAKVEAAISLVNELAAEAKVEGKVEKKVEGEVAAEEEPTVEKPVDADDDKPGEVAVVKKAAVAKKSAAVKKPANPEDELVDNLVTTERLRRQALDAQAMREINEARRCMSDDEYAEVVRHYGVAAKLLNDRPNTKLLRQECEQGIAEGLYRAALQENELGRHDRAVQLLEKAVDLRHPKARRQLEKWVEADTKVEGVKDLAAVQNRKNEADYKAQRDLIRRHLRRSRQLLALKDLKKALEEVEIVLVNDPSNQEAIRLRQAIEEKRLTILQQERVASREGMIADVDEAWRPVYAVNAARLNETTAETVKEKLGDDPERTQEQEIERRMKEMRLPTISFKPPATIIDAIEFFRQASKDYDRPDIPVEKRGFNFVLRTPQGAIKTQQAEANESDDFSANAEEGDAAPTNGLEPIQTITASDISFHEALKLVCDSVAYKFIVRGPVVMVMPNDMSTAELLSRKYNVPEAFMERVTSASEEMKEMGGFGQSKKKANDSDEEAPDRDWKVFFEEMGVKWPEGSSIKHIKALGKLYVRNTRENLAEFEKVLDELGGQPQLIEIETRFVEVSQEDLNSLGFEWILNSDYSLNVGDRLGKALGVRNSTWGTDKSTTTITTANSTTTTTDGNTVTGGARSSDVSTSTTELKNSTTTSVATDQTLVSGGSGGTWRKSSTGNRAVGVNAFGGTSDQQNGNRYLSTTGNHISGESASTNDQFMRVNAFLGNADLSMILHMLSQRSDTDLLSAPKIVTKSGENAVIKVVTEYIYPQDYQVQLQSSSSGSSGSSGSSQSAILAVVEPQNFTMREVGVILDVTPTYNEANGGTIDLELKPQVVDEPTWKNYGMKIPFTGNSSLENFEGIGDIFTGLSEIFTTLGTAISDTAKSALADQSMSAASKALDGLTSTQTDNMTYYDAPMEQPFFHVRSIDSKVSITPGSTVVMGGLITEQRKAMDDKIPWLGDLPYIGRLFRSHAEQTIKRNLLIFVTGRLITPSGRELRMDAEQQAEAEVKPAPKAE